MIVDGCEGSLRGTVPVKILDLSRGGLRFETHASVRPGTTCEVRAQVEGLNFSARILITRCSATGSVPDGRGGHALLYRGGATIVRMEPPHEDELQTWIDRRVEVRAEEIEQAQEGVL